jgi:hypothetical protein
MNRRETGEAGSFDAVERASSFMASFSGLLKYTVAAVILLVMLVFVVGRAIGGDDPSTSALGMAASLAGRGETGGGMGDPVAADSQPPLQWFPLSFYLHSSPGGCQLHFEGLSVSPSDAGATDAGKSGEQGQRHQHPSR